VFNPVLYQGRSVCVITNSKYFCSFVANDILASVDETVEPCEQFYEFACGTWLKNTRIPDDGKLFL